MDTCLKLWSRICKFCTLFKIYNLDIFNPIWTGPPANPKKLRRGQNGISSLIGYFKVTMKLEKSFDDVIVISMLWSHHRFDVWPQLKSRFWGFLLNISKMVQVIFTKPCHFLDNYPQYVLKVKDRSIFDGREKSGIFVYDFGCVTELWAKIWNQKPKITPYTKFYLDPQKNSKDFIPLFLMLWQMENDDYDVIPSNWRWRHQVF